jgi:low affinity Fe/Cu permease
MRNIFRIFSAKTSHAVGQPYSFILALVIIFGWAVSGPWFDYSDTWQLVINTGTTIVTFLMVFLIQNTQNRDAKAIHLKLDELLNSTKSARNRMINLEEMTDEEMEVLQTEFRKLQERSLKNLDKVKG